MTRLALASLYLMMVAVLVALCALAVALTTHHGHLCVKTGACMSMSVRFDPPPPMPTPVPTIPPVTSFRHFYVLPNGTLLYVP